MALITDLEQISNESINWDMFWSKLLEMMNSKEISFDDMADTIRYLVERNDRSIIGDPAVIYRNILPVIRNG